jgi:DNA mismatch repair protein MutL
MAMVPMPIQILPDELAAKIAAGEVIERPASVAKELIENALDAGAHDIRVEVRGGGQRLLRVADDGCGIPAAEVVTAFARHATSKIKSADDLFAIRTLGFRGEALPSIAAVARLTVITHAQGEDNGTLYKLEASRTLAHQPFGAPRGTVVTVEELFQNVPARLKFLKGPGTEAAHIAELINAYALAYPHVRFSLVNDGRLQFQTHGNGKLFDVLLKVFGVEVAREMIVVTTEDGGRKTEDAGSTTHDGGQTTVIAPSSSVIVHGYVSPPSIHRASRKLQYLFVNGRWIEDRALSHAVVEAYHTLLMVGRFPLFALSVRVPLDAVDVNVHPQKSQVRFRNPSEVYVAMQRTVRRALTDTAPVPSLAPTTRPAPAPFNSQLTVGATSHAALSLIPSAGTPALTGDTGEAVPAVVPMLRVIGQIASTYIIAEGPDGLYLVDQHAAHERVLYEQFTAAHTAQTSGTPHVSRGAQELLEPLAVSLSPAQWAVYVPERAQFEHVGFRLEEFGGQTVMLRAIPSVIKNREPRALFVEVLDELIEGEAPLAQDAEARLITSICKGAAVKGGQILTLEEMRALVRDLEKTTSPRTCPHGRPTMIQLNLNQLEREFGRRG